MLIRVPRLSLHQALVALIVLLCFASISCGTGGSSGNNTTLGSAGLGPNPEDINDIPNAVPDDFNLVSCPHFSGFTEVEDLKLVAYSTGARTCDLNQDTFPDATLLTAFNPVPETVLFKLFSLNGTSFPYSSLLLGQETILGGYETDENNNPFPNTFGSFGDVLLPGAWVGPLFSNPILAQFYIPGSTGAPNAPPIPPEGFEGDNGGGNPMCNNLPINMCPGVHVFIGRFATTDNLLHCSNTHPWRIVVSTTGQCPP